MTNNEEFLKQADLQKIAEDGAKIYEQIKVKYEPQQRGKFLALEVESKKTYIGNTSAEALESARKEHPGKIFYVVKIGFDVADTLAESFTNKSYMP